ncbi:hypothetical protein LEP1GSC058_3606 [Leptospira fainei serovar Hurstbridge str. BUT 6]|uniref:Uncharacterized protein n=1 Tax=Leptospira fainei serovar Hurstbridge str. BUT 6 TaxID=1193011 RepID=S3V1J0_9LEPT|nr:hypothetical protein LEP1GSC058_3606 [Leptospira fainei serovar Hurstbridge str. BUT 6]
MKVGEIFHSKGHNRNLDRDSSSGVNSDLSFYCKSYSILNLQLF